MFKEKLKTLLLVLFLMVATLSLPGYITIKDAGWANRNLLTSLLPDQDTVPVLDKVHTLHTISTAFSHHEIHEGDSFYFPTIDTLGASDEKQYLLTAQASGENRAHLVFSASSEGAASYYIIEAPTVVTGVQALPVYNRNRNSSTASNLTVESVTVLATGGTVIEAFCTGSGQTSPGDTRGEAELILKDDTEYVIDVQSDAASNVICVNLSWYEADETP